MDLLQIIVLGVVQGLTEFLPVSSSGHLVLFQNYLGFEEPELLLDTSLHLGTLVAVIIFFRRDLQAMAAAVRRRRTEDDPALRLILAVLLGSIPTAILGVGFKASFEQLFGSVEIVGVMLLATGLILAMTYFIPLSYTRRALVPWYAALVIGLAQGLAITPGVSRSGITIAAGLLMGLNRDLAGRYSFLLAIPAIIGAALLQFDLQDLHRVGPLPLSAGFLAAALTGLLALKILMGMVRGGRLAFFAPYCWVVGLVILL